MVDQPTLTESVWIIFQMTGTPDTNSLIVRNARKALRGRTDTLFSSCMSTAAASLDLTIVTITRSRFHKYFGEIKMATTTLKTSSLPRDFVFNGSRIPDPDPQMSIDQVRDLLTPSYPEIATATMTGPEDTGTSLRYSFSRAIGSKG
jgi:PRTRC genetic system protein C